MSNGTLLSKAALEEFHRHKSTQNKVPRQEHTVSRRPLTPAVLDIESQQRHLISDHKPDAPVAQKPRYSQPAGKESDKSYVKPVLLCIGVSFLLILALSLGILLLNHSGAETQQQALVHESVHQVSSLPFIQDFPENPTNMRVYFFNFTTGTQIQNQTRYPKTGGIPYITRQNLRDCSTCCFSQHNKFICAGRNAFSGGGVFIEAFIEKDPDYDDMYLLLWVNSNDLREVECWSKLMYVVN